MKIKVIAILTAVIFLISYVPVYAETELPAPPSDAYEYCLCIDGPVIYFITDITRPH